jgi:hypothetical protein
MSRWTVLSVVITLCVISAMSCSGGKFNPVTSENDLTGNAVANPEQTHLWGYYDVYIDIPTQTATAVPNRGAMFAANVVQFVNSPASNLSFLINGTPTGTGYVDVDINVSIKHPFTGLTIYNGYDVRGIFIGNGSTAMKYDTGLKYAAHKGTADQEMYDYAMTSPDPGKYGNPDGYTRWFNPTEFATTGLFGFTKGMVATPGYTGTATLNPYKYFADGLGVADNAYTFMTTTPNHGVFSAGATNTRNYYLRFPTSLGVKFNYAIVANWKGEAPADHPANAPEACAISASVINDVYYVSPSDKGGKLKVNFSLPLKWGCVPSTVYLESSVLTTPYQLSTSEMVPTGGTAAYSTYHAEVTANNITGNSSTVNHEFWVIAQYDKCDHKNTFGVTNGAGDDKLAAFFRYDLYVHFAAYNKPPVITSGITGNATPSLNATETYAVVASDPEGGPLTYSWTIKKAGTPLPSYNGVPGNGAGNLVVNFAAISGLVNNDVLNFTCRVTDNKSAYTDATPLDVTVKCPTTIYTTSFAASEGEATNWSRTAPYWACHWFDGAIADDESSCGTYGTPNYYAWRTNGFVIPSCWSGNIVLSITHSCSKQETYYDRGGVWYSLNGSSWLSLPFYDHAYNQGQWWDGSWSARTDHAYLQSFVSPGGTIYIRFDSYSLDGWGNSASGWNITDMTIAGS